MDEEPKTKEESWAVEPQKKGGNKKRKALRVALIVAALGTVALVGVGLVVGNSIRKQFKPMYLGLFGENPHTAKVCVDQRNQAQYANDFAESTGNTIAGGHDGAEGK